jgi:hypothetical protein
LGATIIFTRYTKMGYKDTRLNEFEIIYKEKKHNVMEDSLSRKEVSNIRFIMFYLYFAI